jgi:hypothetical protein
MLALLHLSVGEGRRGLGGGLVHERRGDLHAEDVGRGSVRSMSANASSSLRRFVCLSVRSLPCLITIAGPPHCPNLPGLSAQGKELKTRWWRANNSRRGQRKG